MTTAKSRKAPVRQVFGRVKNVWVGDRCFKFELTRDGLRVRERNHRKVELLSFELLAAGGWRSMEAPGLGKIEALLTAEGVEVKAVGQRKKLVPATTLANAVRDQMVLFAGGAA